jgi:folate-binding protein YgfZ
MDTFYTILPNRGGIEVSGDDAFDFLQSLITQDMTLLDSQALIYSALLTPQGKIEYDFFVLKHNDGYIIECELDRAEALLKRLSTFKLRKKVSLKIIQLQVVSIWGDDDALKAFSYPTDPRHNILGLRLITLESLNKTNLSALEEKPVSDYHRQCIKCMAPNGRRDIAIGEDTIADLSLDKINGVSYTKGCYMGQELTSRMHHRGLAKKRLYAVHMTGTPLPAFTDITVDGNLIGEMRSSVGNIGLAVLRHDSLQMAAKAGLTVIEN